MTYKIWIITLFPDYFNPLLECGVTGSALRGERGHTFQLNLVQLRHFSPKDYKGVDDSPYGGGAGMIMRADVLKEALMKGVVEPGGYGENFREKLHVVYTSARGIRWNHQITKQFAETFWAPSKQKDLVFICGRYEGIDERFLESYVDAEYSLGEFIFSGGEIPVLTMIDTALRFVPGVLGNSHSSVEESFSNSLLLEHPQYTRPAVFDEKPVPEIMLSGHHKNIVAYQHKERERITKKWRPDLYQKYLEEEKK